MRSRVWSLALISGLRSGIALNYGVGRRCGLALALLWLWCRPAAAAPIQPLARELPYAMGAALTKQNNNNKKAKSGEGKSNMGQRLLSMSCQHHDVNVALLRLLIPGRCLERHPCLSLFKVPWWPLSSFYSHRCSQNRMYLLQMIWFPIINYSQFPGLQLWESF